MSKQNSLIQVNAGDSGQDGTLSLERRDLVNFEPRLRETLRSILGFEQGLLYFPKRSSRKSAERVPEYLEKEQTLLFPLYNANEELLAVFSAKGIEPKAAEIFLTAIPSIARLCIENLALHKNQISDPLTGLATCEHFIKVVAADIEALREGMRYWAIANENNASASGNNLNTNSELGRSSAVSSAHSCCFSVLSIKVVNFNQLINEHGADFSNAMLVALATALDKCLAGRGLSARISGSSFGVLLPQCMPKQSRAIASELAQCLSATGVYSQLMATQIIAKVAVGLSSCPSDLGGDLGGNAHSAAQHSTNASRGLPSKEQANLLLLKAEKSALIAQELPGTAIWPPQYNDTSTEAADSSTEFKHHSPSARVMSYSRILYEGGKINEILPLSRVSISLGQNAGVIEGMRFAVWSIGGGFSISQRRALYKGEISVIDVKGNYAIAELHSLADPAFAIAPGDRLTLLQEMTHRKVDLNSNQDLQLDSCTGLLKYSDFLAAWSEQRQQCANFSLSLLRIAYSHEKEALIEQLVELSHEEREQDREQDAEQAIVYMSNDEQLRKAVELCREKFGSDVLGGRYGLSSLIFYHPEKPAAELKLGYEEISQKLESYAPLISSVSVGIAPHPFLKFRNSEAITNCHKALDYALLLPEPHVGITDSLALNISADKKMSSGDSFGALEEYKLAILADENNTLAWNSLGVCLAELGRGEDARGYFEEVLKRDPDDLEAHYNLGQVFQSLALFDDAVSHYQYCINLDSEHVFAYLRLGQIAEQQGDIVGARTLYEKTSLLKGGVAMTSRLLSRLCMKEGKTEEARSHLYKALEYNPQDAVARYLIAELYLEGGEDPEMAESQARQAVVIAPRLKQAWLTLSKALEAVGKPDQAKEAKANATKLL